MKNTVDGLISRLDMTKKSELEKWAWVYVNRHILKWKTKKRKNEKGGKDDQRAMGQLLNVYYTVIVIQKEEKGTEEIFEIIVAESFPKLIRHQTTVSGSSKNTTQDE